MQIYIFLGIEVVLPQKDIYLQRTWKCLLANRYLKSLYANIKL